HHRAGRCTLLATVEVQLVGRQNDEREAPEDADAVDDVTSAELMAVASPLGSEDLAPELVALRLVDATDLDLADDQLGEAELGTPEDEDRPARDAEAGSL